MRLIARIPLLCLLACLIVTGPAWANERNFRLAAPAELIDSGLLKYMLPRFSLKTQVRITLVAPGEQAEAAFGDTGKPVFDGLNRQWHLAALSSDHQGVMRFRDWITSRTGQSAITGFKVDGVQQFGLPSAKATAVVALTPDGDVARGEVVSRTACRRCHAISPKDRMTAIGSTPSFYVLRSLPDWADRFEAFYVLNPHPSFTQIDGVTPPFPENRPSPIVPVTLSLEDLEAIIAFVTGIEPADLGAPLVHQ